MRRAWLFVLAAAVLVGGAACKRREAAKGLDLELIRVSTDAVLRTDTVGGGAFTDTATFVLVDAENHGEVGAYVTLGGALVEQGGAEVGELKAQSLWIPAGESRTFALVDAERKPRPAARTVRIEVRGAVVPDDPPRARIEELHRFVDQDRLVVQAYLVNDADRIGQIVVIGAFHDEANRPMTRPFELVEIAPRSRQVVKFISPPRAKRGTIFVGDAVY
ncbi:MAG TPA: hypothetical protein VN253_17895 [Kofleriaceae bacterium]|nr:hypothetical protein [Kofleriaceae bacterium]